MPSLPLPPGSTLGIIGGGQLGRMLSQAASRLGFDVVILDPEANSPAGRVSARQIVAAYDDPDALTALGRAADVVTFEFENVPAASIERLAEAGALVAPGPTALRVSQDRADEKTFLNAVGAPTVQFAVVDTLEDLIDGLTVLGVPALLKTRREGYDGKGQVWIRDIADAAQARHQVEATTLKTLPLLREAGVRILAGTDAGFLNSFNYPGFSLHDELALYVANGLTPREALEASVINGPALMGVSDRYGAVAPGKAADLIVLDADPLTDIAATRRINAVVRDGRLLDRAELDGVLADIRSRVQAHEAAQ